MIPLVRCTQLVKCNASSKEVYQIVTRWGVLPCCWYIAYFRYAIVDKGFQLLITKIYESKIWLSDHRKTVAVELSDALTNEHSCVATTAAINSSLGRECFLSCAALDLDIRSVEFVPCCRYITAPYVRGLASANMCRVDSDVGNEGKHCLGKGSSVAYTMSRVIWFQCN